MKLLLFYSPHNTLKSLSLKHYTFSSKQMPVTMTPECFPTRKSFSWDIKFVMETSNHNNENSVSNYLLLIACKEGFLRMHLLNIYYYIESSNELEATVTVSHVLNYSMLFYPSMWYSKQYWKLKTISKGKLIQDEKKSWRESSL